MSVLVTGGAGYIGSHMVLELLDAGRDVVVVDNLVTGFRAAVPPEAAFVEADIADVGAMRGAIASHGVTAIIHFAGSVVVPDSVSDPLGYYLNNTVKSRTLIETAVETGIKAFIFSSTAAVYGMTETCLVTEDEPLRPMSPYGSSKLMTETMLRDASAAHGLPYAALRYFNVAGADPKGRAGQCTVGATHLIKVACEAATGVREGLKVFGTDYETADGTCVRDYIHVADLAKAHALALDHLETEGENLTLNCGYGEGYSVLEVVEAVQRSSGKDFSVAMEDRRPGDPAAIVADSTRLKTLLGWEPAHADLDEIVGDALGWQRLLDTHKARIAA
ncbi:MAG: UDP-glucose 4-epimerase GalE [Pseudomonadota bacterium]